MGIHSKIFKFKHAVGVSIEDLELIKRIKGEASIGGKLHEIIEFYKIKFKL